MKKQIVTVAIALITAVSFGQKKEVKKAAKEVKSKDYAAALSLLSEAEGLLGSADEETKGLYYITKAEALSGSAGNDFSKLKMAADALVKAKETDPSLFNEIEAITLELRAALVNSAIKDQNANNYKMASDKLYTSYTISKKDTSDLYYAAGNAINNEDYDTALTYYKMLNDLGFTDIKKEYIATNKTTGEIETFGSIGERDLIVKSGEYSNPSIRKTDSKRGEVLRNITLIYIEKGEDDKASELIKSARAENPEDTGLLRADADMAYRMGDMQRYNSLMNEIIATDPNNPDIHFSLGIAASELGEKEKAMEYYERAIELKPDYAGALINLGALKLEKEASIVEEMNGLGTSRADNARYDELKAEREALYREVAAHFEKAVVIEEDNVGLVKTLVNIYSQLGEDAKKDAMKAKLDKMQQ
ncbi:tetratricopeptide repeat protein [Jejudonia soesokkakensis]|uniref:Tetratricopeptide repeat protein n=1 Tax=Jejudonia soesokkakensis TaxID=1323432 RepID=A0ABW2MUV5_9FLAO